MNILRHTQFLSKLIAISITYIGFFFIVSLYSKIHAQSFGFSPAQPTVAVNGTASFDLVAVNPPAKTASIRISFPAQVTVTNFVTPGTAIALAGSGCTGLFTNNSLCFDISKIGSANFTNGESLGTITVRGVSNGNAVATFQAGTLYLNGSAITGSPGTIVVGSGGGGTIPNAGGSIPKTGILDDNQLFLTVGLLSISIALLAYLLKPQVVYALVTSYKQKQIDDVREEFSKKIVDDIEKS